jgi:mRNA-degrading endonuclease RelE of RelBE toxin-antitoxin system
VIRTRSAGRPARSGRSTGYRRRSPQRASEFVYGGLAQNPHQVGRPLRVDLGGKHSARRGDFRVIYEVDGDRRGVTVVAVDHRSDAYRRR